MASEEPSRGVRDPRQGLPSPPHAAWMWKPRSQLVDSDGNAKHATSLLLLRRIGATQWNRRFVFLDHHLFCYGKDKGRKDKQIPFELIETVRRETADKLRREHAPKEFSRFGWCLAVKGRTLHFCAESEETAEQWVRYIESLVRVMKGTLVAPPPPGTASSSGAAAAALSSATPEMLTPARGATLAEIGAQYDKVHPTDVAPYDTLATITSPKELLTDEMSMQTPDDYTRPQQASLAASPAPPPSSNLAASTGGMAQSQKTETHDNDVDIALSAPSEQLSNNSSNQAHTVVTGRTAQGGQDSEKADDDGNGNEDAEGEIHGSDNRDRRSDISVLDVSSDDTEGEDNEDDDEGEADGEGHARTRTANRTASRSAAAVNNEPPPARNVADRPLPREVRYARFLLPLAADPHSHIDYRISALASYFKSGDDISSVTFSRTMEKISKRDNAQTREVVLTTRHLYFFHKGRVMNSQRMRCIDTRDITGVVESTADSAVVAILVPTFHDVLLKVVPQNSCVPGTSVEVKQQLIAHLYKAHCDVHTNHRFLFRESATVAKEIRRTVEAKHPPLVVHAGDQMRVGEKVSLLETFAKNADEAVYWSSMVRQVQADRQPRLCALVVTESSIYSLSDTLQEVVRRTFMRDLLHVEYDQDAQSILLQCRGVGVLFNMQSSAEFDDFLRVLPTAMADGFGRMLRLNPSKQLYSHAKLFSLSMLHGAGSAGTPHSAARRRRGVPWPKGKKSGGGSKLLTSFAAAAGEPANDGAAAAAAKAFHHNSQAIRVFCAPFRFVEEVLLDYDDALALWQQYEDSAGLPCWDTLRLRTNFMTRLHVGEICLSAVCRLLDAKECATLAKPSALDLPESVVNGMGTPRAICVTSEGFLFLRNGVAASAAVVTAEGPPGSTDATSPAPSSAMQNKLKSRLSAAVSQISGAAGKDDDLVMGLIGWSSIAAVVRCHDKEGSSVALLTNRTHPVDYLFHLASAQTMLHVMAAAMGCYAQYRHGNPDHKHLLPLYAAPRVNNLAVALKKTIFDPFPTVALRYTPYSFPSDRLRMAFVPDVADACRRFGDNTIHFSGVAWRVRSATLRKHGGHLEEDPGADMRRRNNHLYKSYIFVLTNVAIYHCTKGGFEVVRRTLLRDIKHITVGLHDTDTVLLAVPSEYDMYFRTEGRGAEVVARLQEAYVEWTNYGHYLPHERQGSHTIEAYGLPVRQAACVAALGKLTKPTYFNDLQRSRSTAECRHQTQQWHLRCLRRAITSFESAQIAARKERRFPSAAATGPLPRATWSRMHAALAERQSFLYFVQRRCFRFGLTSEDFVEMQRAQRLLRSYREMEASAAALIAAASGTDAEAFQAALHRASAVPDLRLLVEEETRVYEGYLARSACLTAIFSTVQRYRYRPNGDATSLVALEARLLDLLHEGHRVGFDPAFLRYVMQMVRVLVQRTQIQRIVCNPANRQRLAAMQDGGWVLVQQAAGEVGMTWRPPFRATATRSPSAWLQLNVRTAQLALKCSVMTGESALIRGATALAVSVLEACERYGTTLNTKERDAAAVIALRRALAVVQDVHTPSKEEDRQRLVRAVESLVAARQTHQRQQTWTPSLVSGMLATCLKLEEQVAAQPFPLLHHGTQSVLEMEHAMLTEEQHRLQLRHALANREIKAQQNLEDELRRCRLKTQRADASRQRREATAQERRQRKALALWRSQVDQLVSKLDAMLANSEETDESVRLSIKRCVHLQRWIVEANTHFGLSLPASAVSAQRRTPPSLSAVHRRPASPALGGGKGDKVLAELLAKLQSAAAHAQHHLDKRARGGVDAYGATQRDGLNVVAAEVAFDGDREGDVSVVAPALPIEVEQLIEALDTDGLVAYVHQHLDAAPPAMLDQIRLQWQRARRRQRWVVALHRRLHAAAVLHSRELLEAVLQQAAEAHYTDAAVETAHRAVAAMKTQQKRQRQQRQKRTVGESLDAAATSASTSLSSSLSLSFMDPWRWRRRAPSAESAEGTREEFAAAAPETPVLHTAEETEEKPTVGVDSTDDLQEDGNSLRDTVENSVEAEEPAAPVNAKLDEVTKAMEAVAHAAETVAAALPHAKFVLQQLYAATVALVGSAVPAATSVSLPVVTPSTSTDATPTASDAIYVTADNPFCAPFLQAWRAVLQHQLRPSGVLLKAPRTVWDVVRHIGEANTDGDYAAPYVTRLCSDFRRLYRSTEDSDAARQRTDAVLLALIVFSHRMTCVWDGLIQVGEKGRRELLLPDSLMGRPEVVQALLAAACVCDTLQWQFSSVRALAIESLFPRDGAAVEVPLPPRLSHHHTGITAAHSDASQNVGFGAATPTLRVSPPPEVVQARPLSSVKTSPVQTPPRTPAVSPSALKMPAIEENAAGTAAMREERAVQVLRGLQESVCDIASYFTQQLRRHGVASGESQTTALIFDEHRYAEVGTLVEASILPSLLEVFTCGLLQRYQPLRTRTLWAVLAALKETLTASPRTLAAAEVLPMMSVVEALTGTSDARGRPNTKLRARSDAELDELRVRVFLRECLNRRKLHAVICALFPPLEGNEAWVKEGSGALWTFYDPALCLLYPPEAESSVRLRPLLEKLSALPFVLIPDRELR